MLGNSTLWASPGPPRLPQTEVTLTSTPPDVNVSARDKATGKEQQITIQSSGGLSDAQVEQIPHAEAHATPIRTARS